MRRYAKFVAVALAIVVLEVALLRPILFTAGVPAMHHDWEWPLTPGGISSLALNISAPLVPSNWNEIAWYPRLNVVQPLLLLLNVFFGPSHVLNALLLVTLAMAMVGSFLLARAFGAGYVTALVAAAWYGLSPFVIDQLVAGHQWILWAYAATPFAIEALVRGRRWEAACFWTCVTALDIHFIGFDVLLFLLLAGTRTVPLSKQFGAWLGLIAFLPPVAGALIASHAGVLQSQRTLDLYEIVNSVPLVDALRGMGYFAGYDRIGNSMISQLCLFLPLVLGIAAAVFRKALFPLTVLLVAALIAAGVHGPFDWIERQTFAAIPAVSVYRELFDIIALFNIGAVCALATIQSSKAIVSIVAVVAMLALLPGLTAAYGPELPKLNVGDHDLNLVRSFEAQPGHALLLALPVQPPIAAQGFPGGLNPLGNTVGGHGLIDAEHNLPAIARAGIVMAEPERARWFTQLHVGAILSRPAWKSVAPYRLEPGFGITPPPLRYGAVLPWNMTRLSPSAELFVASGLLCASGDYTSIRDVLSFAADDPACAPNALVTRYPDRPYPKTGWVSYDSLWYLARGAASALPGAMFTTQTGLQYPSVRACVPGRTYVYDVYEERSGEWARSMTTMKECQPPFTRGPTVISGVRDEAQVATKVGGTGGVEIDRNLQWFVTARGRIHGTAMIVLQSAYSTWWLAMPSGAIVTKHHRVLGFFNGWTLRGDGPVRITLLYAPALLIFALMTLVVVLHIWLAAALLPARRNRAS